MIRRSEFRNPKYQDYIRFVRDAIGLPRSLPIELSPLEGRGSDRAFYRLKWDREHSAILIDYDPKREENLFYVEIASFLCEINVPVPKIIHHDPNLYLIVVEDLGDTDLWSLRKEPWETRRTLYQRTLTIAHKLHCHREKDFPFHRVRLMEGFGPDLYRWERDYFKNHFLRGICRIELEDEFEGQLEAELSGLADRLSKSAHGLIHRDLQSQNVMIRDGQPFLIDFQGMRFGTPFYDLASLLSDPYACLPDGERLELLSDAYTLESWDLDWEDFQKTFWEASAQRLMQALGAYGFLGIKRGLKDYLDHIPVGLRHLQLSVREAGSLPLLEELSFNCQEALGKMGGLS